VRNLGVDFLAGYSGIECAASVAFIFIRTVPFTPALCRSK
jgi:hypothetical protein